MNATPQASDWATTVVGVLSAVLGAYAWCLQHAPLTTIVTTWLVAYGLSLVLHPFSRCRACKGVGKHFGGIFKRAFSLCSACAGTGRQRRWGVSFAIWTTGHAFTAGRASRAALAARRGKS